MEEYRFQQNAVGMQMLLNKIPELESSLNAANNIFGDKQYSVSDYSGLGRENLPKNVKNIDGVTANYLEQSMMTKANTVYVIQYDYQIGVPQTKSVTFSTDNMSGVMTVEKKNLDDRTALYNTALATYNTAETAYDNSVTAYNSAKAAYDANPTEENLVALTRAEKTMTASESAKDKAESTLERASKNKQGAQAEYEAAGSLDYYCYAEVAIEAGRVLYITGKAILLNDARTEAVDVVNGMVMGGSEGRTVYLGNYAGTVSYRCDACVTIPAGCQLLFQGGSISGGAIIGTNTQIIAARQAIFNDIHISGSWMVPNITSAWFADASQNNVLRQVFALQNGDILNTIIIEEGEYTVSVDVDGRAALECLSNLNLVVNGTINLEVNDFGTSFILLCKGVNHINISGSGAIVGDKLTHTGTTGEWGMGLEIYGSNFITIKDLKVEDCWGDCIYIGGNGSANIILDNCYLDNARRNGVSITNGYNVVIQNCRIENVGGTNPQSAIDIETNTNKYASNILVSNNFIDNCQLGVTIYGRSNYTKTSISVENNYINCTWRAIAVNGVSTCVSIRNNELRALYNVVDANTIDASQDNVILFENNMVFQTEIPTEAPFNQASRMCAFYAMKGDYLFRHNNINTVMPVFRFASGSKCIENNEITCPTLFAERGASDVRVIGNLIEGNVTLPGSGCWLQNNTINGYLRSTPEAVTDETSRIIGNYINHPQTGSSITEAWEVSQGIETQNTNEVVVLKGSRLIIENNRLRNVALNIGGGKVAKNIIQWNSNFTMTGILLNLGAAEFLHNTVEYNGTNANNANIYIIRTSNSIIGNNISAASRIQYVFYATQGCFIQANDFTLPNGHASGHIVPAGTSLQIEPLCRNVGTTAQRPALPEGDYYYKGCKYFDIDLEKEIFWNGTAWVDALGNDPDAQQGQ